MNIYSFSNDDEFLSDLKQWIKNNKFEIPPNSINCNAQNGSNNGFYGYHHTDESKKLISENQKGWKHTEEIKLKMSLDRTGVKRPAWVGEKISKSISGENHHMWGKETSSETKKKISQTKQKNPYKHNEESRRKISEAAKLREMKKKCLI